MRIAPVEDASIGWWQRRDLRSTVLKSAGRGFLALTCVSELEFILCEERDRTESVFRLMLSYPRSLRMRRSLLRAARRVHKIRDISQKRY